jgi:hypothetical protein
MKNIIGVADAIRYGIRPINDAVMIGAVIY